MGETEYRIIGVMGLKNTASVVDYSMVMSIENAKNTFGSNIPLLYTIDGNKKVW